MTAAFASESEVVSEDNALVKKRRPVSGSPSEVDQEQGTFDMGHNDTQLFMDDDSPMRELLDNERDTRPMDIQTDGNGTENELENSLSKELEAKLGLFLPNLHTPDSSRLNSPTPDSSSLNSPTPVSPSLNSPTPDSSSLNTLTPDLPSPDSPELQLSREESINANENDRSESTMMEARAEELHGPDTSHDHGDDASAQMIEKTVVRPSLGSADISKSVPSITPDKELPPKAQPFAERRRSSRKEPEKSRTNVGDQGSILPTLGEGKRSETTLSRVHDKRVLKSSQPDASPRRSLRKKESVKLSVQSTATLPKSKPKAKRRSPADREAFEKKFVTVPIVDVRGRKSERYITRWPTSVSHHSTVLYVFRALWTDDASRIGSRNY